MRTRISDDQVAEKFRVQSALVVGDDAMQVLLDICWKTPELQDVAEVARASAT